VKLLCNQRGLDKLAELLGRDVASRKTALHGKLMFEVLTPSNVDLSEAHLVALKALGILILEE
jgi:hypothetical protein